jgi:hypothetical protein
MALTDRDQPMKARLIEAERHRLEAIENRKVASLKEAAGFDAHEYRRQVELDENAFAKLMLEVPSRDIVTGEIVPSKTERPDTDGGWAVRNTLASPDVAAYAASLERTQLLAEGHKDVLALAVDAASAINSDNSLETMLAHQMALAHQSAFRLMDSAMSQREPVEKARLVNASARLMMVYQQALLTLHRLRTGGTQTVKVQHVHVSGGQALVADNIQTGGGSSPSGSRG